MWFERPISVRTLFHLTAWPSRAGDGWLSCRRTGTAGNVFCVGLCPPALPIRGASAPSASAAAPGAAGAPDAQVLSIFRTSCGRAPTPRAVSSLVDALTTIASSSAQRELFASTACALTGKQRSRSNLRERCPPANR